MEAFIGEIRLMASNYAPRGWAFCHGQTLSIGQNTALFSLLGTTYGGNGQTTFALPDLRGRAALGKGQGPGLSNYIQGQAIGAEQVTLTLSQLPAHSHALSSNALTSSGPAVNTSPGTTTTPVNNYFATPGSEEYGAISSGQTMASDLISGPTQASGGSEPHENRMPYLVLNYCIAVQGIFPQRQ